MADARPTLPWIRTHQQQLAAAQAAGRLSHALLIQDSAAAGGLELAEWIVGLVLCERPGPQGACGTCRACVRLAAGTHADLRRITIEEDYTQIRIEQIRDLSAELALTSHDGRGTVAVIHPADAMNTFAANALLKTLEEPRPGVVVVLVCERASRLPPTIRSRCQRLVIRAPQRAEVLEFLQASKPSPHWPAALDALGNRPLAALAADPAELAGLRDEMWPTLAEAAEGRLDVVAAAERWSRGDLLARLACFENWLTTVVRGAFGTSPEKPEMRGAPHLSYHFSDMNIRSVFRVIDGVRELRGLSATPINKALAIERLLWQLGRSRNLKQVHSE